MVRITPTNKGSAPDRGMLCLIVALLVLINIILVAQNRSLDIGIIVYTRDAESQISSSPSRQKLPRVLAILFPQFHPDPLNDRLWGQGYTDWDNLKASPKLNRLGKPIPRPTDLGYYDLRDTEPRRRQGELAKQYGIDGFVIHHYWFYDKNHPGPTLHAPVEEMLNDGYPDLPFFFNWCETSWIDTWLGKTKDKSSGTGAKMLQRQYFPEKDDPAIVEHYNWLKQFFHHPNYIQVNGEPVFMAYSRDKNSLKVLQRLRELAVEDGFPGLYIPEGNYMPHGQLTRAKKNWKREKYDAETINKTVAYPYPIDAIQGMPMEVPEWCQKGMPPPEDLVPEIPGLITSFDNTPRRSLETAVLWTPYDPDQVVDLFRQSLTAALHYESCCFGAVKEDSFVLINAMNEWAEGMSLEPSDVYGRRFLETVREAKKEVDCYRFAAEREE